ncbi:MAG: urease accessory protein UreD, partial [Pseudomonadota bacterium]|nr:urease accessory protein UreD [Pseudomonadota bacterium]
MTFEATAATPATPATIRDDRGWQARLDLHYRLRDGRCVAQDRHVGPLRVLKALHPEGAGICHHVLVHPPGGLVGGDRLQLTLRLDEGAHALVTTPGATRFYRSEGSLARQEAELHLAPRSRLEWLPLETIAHPGCHGLNRVVAKLEPGAEMIGWDLLALGLPASGQPYAGSASVFVQHLQVMGSWAPAAVESGGASAWIDRARVAGSDVELLQSAPGWGGHPVLGTMWFACGSAIRAARRESLLDAARAVTQAHSLA